MGAGDWVTIGLAAIGFALGGAKLYAEIQVLKSERAEDRRILDRLHDFIMDELRKD